MCARARRRHDAPTARDGILIVRVRSLLHTSLHLRPGFSSEFYVSSVRVASRVRGPVP